MLNNLNIYNNKILYMEASTSSRNKQKFAKLPEQTDVSLIKTSVLMYNGSKKYSLLSYGDENKRDNLFIQTPLFESVLDVEHYKEYGEYYFQVPNNASGNKFLNLINDIEKRLITLAFENKNNWFHNKDNIKFRSAIKNLQSDSIDNDANKVIKFRIPYNIKTKRLFVDSLDNMNTTDTENISIKNLDGGYVRIIVNINAIWFSDDMFGLYIRPTYMEEIKLCEYSFQDNDNVVFLDTELFPSVKKEQPVDDVNVLNEIVKTSVKAFNAKDNFKIDTLSQSPSMGRRLRKSPLKQNNNIKQLLADDMPLLEDIPNKNNELYDNSSKQHSSNNYSDEEDDDEDEEDEEEDEEEDGEEDEEEDEEDNNNNGEDSLKLKFN